MKKKILIIGGCGFIGSHVADFLQIQGNKVIVFDKKKPKFKNNKIKYYYGDILKSKILPKIISQSEIVYNFAALADLDIARLDPEKTIKINILGTINILSYCKKYNVKRIIQASSIYANSQEGGFYAISKRSAEEYIIEFSKVFNLNYTILRLGSVYGERADTSNTIRKLIIDSKYNNKIIYRGSKNAIRSYINVKDAAKLCSEVIKKKYINKCLIIIGKKSIKIKNLLDFFSKELNIKKIEFRNEKNFVHYDKKPTPAKILIGTKLFLRKEEDFRIGVKNLINQYKKSK